LQKALDSKFIEYNCIKLLWITFILKYAANGKSNKWLIISTWSIKFYKKKHLLFDWCQ